MGRGSEPKIKYQVSLQQTENVVYHLEILAWSGTLKCTINMLGPEKEA